MSPSRKRVERTLHGGDRKAFPAGQGGGRRIRVFGLFRGGWSQTQQLFAELVNVDFFDVLGVQPFLGRGFSQAQDASPSPVAAASRLEGQAPMPGMSGKPPLKVRRKPAASRAS